MPVKTETQLYYLTENQGENNTGGNTGRSLRYKETLRKKDLIPVHTVGVSLIRK